MITVWFAADVLDKFKDRNATMRTCENCIVQYLQTEHKREGKLKASSRVQTQLCEIVLEAVLESVPALRDTLDLTYKQLDSQTGAIEVRLSPRFRYYTSHSNPGLMRLH
jgi:hypothetical protein